MPSIFSKPIAEHAEVPLADDGDFEKLVEHWQSRSSENSDGDDAGIACYVVSVGAERDPVARNAQLAEIVALVEHQGGRVVGQELRHLIKADPRTLLGKGTARAHA
jgi:hypothetical protein